MPTRPADQRKKLHPRRRQSQLRLRCPDGVLRALGRAVGEDRRVVVCVPQPIEQPLPSRRGKYRAVMSEQAVAARQVRRHAASVPEDLGAKHHLLELAVGQVSR